MLFCHFWGVPMCGISLQSNRENEFYSKLAKLHLEKYNFPVEMIICLPNGTVVRLGSSHRICFLQGLPDLGLPLILCPFT